MKHFFHSFIEPQTVGLWFSYWAYLLIIPAAVAFVFNYFKSLEYKKVCVNGNVVGEESGMPSNLFASHHHWLIRSFVILVVMSMISVGTSYAGIGLVLAIPTVGYFIYRVVFGMARLAAHKPMPGYYC